MHVAARCSRRIGAFALVVLILAVSLAATAQERHAHPPPQPHPRAHPHREAPGAGLDFLGMMLGLFGGLAAGDRARPQCDVAHVGGWQVYRHSRLGHGINLPDHWRRDDSRVDVTLVDIFVNPCPPHAAVLIARLPADRRVEEGDLATVATALQQQGGELFQSVVQHEVIRAPDQSRLAVVYAGRDSGVDLGSLVHFVSTATDLYIVIGLAPRAAGERLGTVLRQAVGSFAPLVRAVPPPAASLDLTGAWIETTAPSARNHLVVIAHSGSDLLVSGTYALPGGQASWIGTGKVDGRQVAVEYRFDKLGAGDRGPGRMTLTAAQDGNRLEGVERSTDGAERRVLLQRSGVPGTAAAAPVDIAGTWRHLHGPNREAWRGETWTFTALGSGRYRAVEQGYGNASGTAELKGDRVVLSYVTRDGKVRGTATLTLNADRTALEGSFRDDQPLSGSYKLLRVPGR